MSKLTNYYYEMRFRLLKCWWSIFDKFVNSIYCDVLMFHHVSDTHIDINDSCQCTRAQFRFILEERLKKGYTFISLDKLYDNMRNGVKGSYCTITFDDVPENFYSAALPILKELSLPFCLFISTDFMHIDGYLTVTQVKELSQNPLCTIGAHTCSHPQLRKVDNSNKELSESKIILEQLIQKKVDYLAYPYGRQSSISYKVRNEAENNGFILAFSTIPTSINIVSKNSKFFLPRVLK